MAARSGQRDLFKDGRHGGRRLGAGRPRAPGRHRNWVRRRAKLSPYTPVHVTLRVVKAVGQLRRRRGYHAIRKALRTAAAREDFRVVHISIQREHIHLICEAENEEALGRGMKGLEVSAARHLNAAVAIERGAPAPRKGTVFPERYHVEQLKTPRQVRNAIGYVLNNWRHHGEHRASWPGGTPLIDPYASGVLFNGWNRERPFVPPENFVPLGTARPQTWLLEHGWRRHGAIDPREVPGEPRDPFDA